MRGVVMHAPGDVRLENREDPRIELPADAIIRVSAACVCGSDLWPYRGIQPVGEPAPMGHEYVGVVEEVGSDVTTIKPPDPQLPGRLRCAGHRLVRRGGRRGRAGPDGRRGR